MQNEIIKTVSYDQEEIIRNILDLYIDGEYFDLDPTYSTGVFYKNISPPKWKFDIDPQYDYVQKSDAKDIDKSFFNEGIRSIMFDPPFVGGSRRKGKDGIIKKRFGCYKNIPALWEWYRECLKSFYDLLEPKGFLVFKCQDCVEQCKQFLSHVEIINSATNIGFYARDLFILLAKRRIIGKTHRNQQHARKYHSYFLVFEKKKCSIPYSFYD